MQGTVASNFQDMRARTYTSAVRARWSVQSLLGVFIGIENIYILYSTHNVYIYCEHEDSATVLSIKSLQISFENIWMLMILNPCMHILYVLCICIYERQLLRLSLYLEKSATCFFFLRLSPIKCRNAVYCDEKPVWTGQYVHFVQIRCRDDMSPDSLIAYRPLIDILPALQLYWGGGG